MKPCDTCKRVKDPVNCEYKNCEVWRQWWIKRWEETRKLFGGAPNRTMAALMKIGQMTHGGDPE